MSAENKVGWKEKLIKIEKITDGGIFLFGAVLVATGIPALVAFGGTSAVYSGIQYATVDRVTKKNK